MDGSTGGILSVGKEGIVLLTHITDADVPDWVVEVIQRLAVREGISLEQASRLLMYQGAIFYSKWLDERKQEGA